MLTLTPRELAVLRGHIDRLLTHLECERNDRWTLNADATAEHAAVMHAARSLDVLDHAERRELTACYTRDP